jgi:von Willebrand factor type A domain
VAFIVDGSGSIIPSDFQVELEAVQNAIGLLEGDSQAMVIQFSGTAVVEVPLQQAEGIGNVDFPQLR